MASSTISVGQLVQHLTDWLKEHPEQAEYKAVTSRDPEGNGFAFLQEEGLFYAGEAQGVYGNRGELEDTKVLVIWAGYPQFSDVWSPEQEDE